MNTWAVVGWAVVILLAFWIDKQRQYIKMLKDINNDLYKDNDSLMGMIKKLKIK